MDLVIGVDMATAAVRAVAVDATGRIHAEAAAPLPAPVVPEPSWVEQDATAWWPAVASVLSALSDDLGPQVGRVAALSVSATSGTVVALDRAGDPLGPALTYADQRAQIEAKAAADSDADRWLQLGLRIRASFGLPKWGWMMRNAPWAHEIARLAHASDVVVGHLIGGPAPTDFSHALKSGFDPFREEWAEKALERLGIASDLRPEVKSPGEVAGKLCTVAAGQTGLPAGCEVRLGMTDSCAAQLAAGAANPGQFVSVLGSTLVLKGTSTELVKDPTGVVYSHRHPDGWWLPGGASSVGGRALIEAFPRRKLADLDREAAETGPATCTVYPLVGTGERFPFAEPTAQAFRCGEPRDEADLYRAYLEGVAFVERLGYERLESLGAPVTGAVSSVGGGSASTVWARIRASVLNRPLVQKPGASTALGAAILAASGSLHSSLAEATAAMAASGTEVEPDLSEVAALEDSYALFRRELIRRGWLGWVAGRV